MSDMSGLIYDQGLCDVGDMVGLYNVSISSDISIVSDKPGKNDMPGLSGSLI